VDTLGRLVLDVRDLTASSVSVDEVVEAGRDAARVGADVRRSASAALTCWRDASLHGDLKPWPSQALSYSGIVALTLEGR
jgi:hypothetical protein